MTDLDEIEIVARMLHARKCGFYKIYDSDLVAAYWEGCDQEMYRMKALQVAIPLPAHDLPPL